jgi:hypothetical protein
VVDVRMRCPTGWGLGWLGESESSHVFGSCNTYSGYIQAAHVQGAINMPWQTRSRYGGTKANRAQDPMDLLLERPEEA